MKHPIRTLHTIGRRENVSGVDGGPAGRCVSGRAPIWSHSFCGRLQLILKGFIYGLGDGEMRMRRRKIGIWMRLGRRNKQNLGD